ncbi:TadE/TadG family type IV pilus assembly protein [Kitasatospora sp. NPDC048540]|uniref:TadE/TadG family type IV pilus assembly protein n=1 Tax=unclassified Kitasatospora TaxID=2633591 RepID=UPI000539E792|nr:TadE/TadG family type IV pilus assembly protein [Kitasatospora sp. MBT63]
MAVEVALLAPVLVAFVVFVVAAGRVQTTGGVVDAAARAAARAASLSRDDEGARTAAAEAAAAVLDQQQVRCTVDRDHLLGYGTLHTGTGDVRTVTAKVSCAVPLGDLMNFHGAPGKTTITGEFTSVIDRYRGN